MRFSTLAAAGLLASGVSAASLNELAVAAGKKYFGAASDNSELSDTAYVAILKEMFGQITPGNGQKWQFTEKSQGVFSYANGDVIADYAKTNSKLLRCHTLVWYSQLPTWVSSGTWTKDQLTSIIDTHISNVVGHYKGQCYAWDVVNEALNEDGTYRDSVFHKVLGTDYIPIAFKAAAAADAGAKLYYNDYNIELAGNKQKEVLNIIKNIKTAGARIDGLGLQAHLIVGSAGSRSALSAVLKSYVDAGVTEVAYTELDIRHTSIPANAAAQEQQATDYVSVVGACLDILECVGVTIWDYTDKYSWIPSVFPGTGEALPWDKDLKPKPAYTSISSLLAAAGKGGAAPATAPVAKPSAPAAQPSAPAAEPSAPAAKPSAPAAKPSAPAAKPSVPERPAPVTAPAAGVAAPTPAPSTTLSTVIKSKCNGPSVKAVPSAPVAAAAAAGGAARWAQCGGNGFTGPTTCQSGLTCQKQNDYYSQCV
ncbi:glycosyl hydrolase family 10 [Colletotrichum orchidophilum]|uniref:Beta-xylanase n=1 Tax=Colletotrichum orchidophilum TaxID=1209926 RepID=A0A1G4ASA7_9PEZI|nr:glycosyl hydrolase family 10 [Colletotrichum orchidophilum]OHE92047.1 glycosyl hydrolase family 10 [Colletotrichum orchidophilum]